MGVLQASWWDCLNSLGISVKHEGQTGKKLVASRVKSCHLLKWKFIRSCLTMEFLSSLFHSTILYFAADVYVLFWGTMVLILNYSLPRTMIFKLFGPKLTEITEIHLISSLCTHTRPGGASGEEPACQGRRENRCRFDPWAGKIPWRRAWQPSPVFLPGESHGQRSLVGYSP